MAHDWLCGYRGGEAVLERIAGIVEREFEAAGLLVMFDDGRKLSPTVDAWRGRGLVHASRHNGWPMSRRLRRWMLPMYPKAVADLSAHLGAKHAERPIDLVISTSSAAIKGLEPPKGVPHLCYCHAPARYVWSQRGEYGGRGLGGALRWAGLRAYGAKFRAWDKGSAAHVGRFLANSGHTAEQIQRCYGREATVVHPPVRTGYFTADATVARGAFWLVVSALEPYKRVDLAMDAARLAGADLVVVGDGSQRRMLEQRSFERVKFLGRVSDEALKRLYQTAALLMMPQIEDFGIAAVEAQACGLPVVARRAGGALDMVIEGVTGSFIDEPTAEAAAAAAARAPRYCAAACRENAERFGEAAFDAALLGHIREMLAVRCSPS